MLTEKKNTYYPFNTIIYTTILIISSVSSVYPYQHLIIVLFVLIIYVGMNEKYMTREQK